MASSSKQIRVASNQYQQSDRLNSMKARDFIAHWRKIEDSLNIVGKTKAIQNWIIPFLHINCKYEYHKSNKTSDDSEPWIKFKKNYTYWLYTISLTTVKNRYFSSSVFFTKLSIKGSKQPSVNGLVWFELTTRSIIFDSSNLQHATLTNKRRLIMSITMW